PEAQTSSVLRQGVANIERQPDFLRAWVERYIALAEEVTPYEKACFEALVLAAIHQCPSGNHA
ncbi:MAG: hypothetical protein ACKPB2_24115, partial [Sphaerospermopsis kisseleviana]